LQFCVALHNIIFERLLIRFSSHQHTFYVTMQHNPLQRIYPLVFTLLCITPLLLTAQATIQIGQEIFGDAAEDYAGRAIALSRDGQHLIVGATGNDNAAPSAGQARVFNWNGIYWEQMGASIEGITSVSYTGFSVAISSDGQRVAISSPYQNTNGTWAGRIRVFQWNGISWDQLGDNIDGTAGSLAGWSLAFSADGLRLGIGGPEYDDDVPNIGHAYVYEWDSTAWVQLGNKIVGEAAMDNFGFDLSL